MNRSGGGPQPLRPMAGNAFQAQPTANRTTPLASQRAPQNGKLASAGSSWAFGMPMAGAGPAAGTTGTGVAGAPGLSSNTTTNGNSTSRTTPLSNFAQAIGGGPSSAQGPLDLAEFPSLGGPQPQPNSVAQAWNSTAIRQSQQQQQQQQQPPPQPPAQRPAPPSQPIQQQQQHQPQQQQRSVSAQTSSSQQHETPAMDPQYDGQSAVSVREASEQGPDEFPPLGGQMNGRINGFGPSDGESTFGSDSSRAPRPANPPGIEQQAPFGASLQQQAPIGQPTTTQQPHQAANFGVHMNEPPLANQPSQLKPVSDMTDDEKWGLPGLLAKLPGRSENGSSLAMGVDPNTLGIDFDDPNPLWPNFSTPFADARSRPVIPEFTLPPAYIVTNVPALASRMPALSDETLFFIFYQNPRDVVQELAAAELYSRDWRWHKKMQQWMMKDGQMGAPMRVSDRSERGVYIFFDANNWRRERREFVLDYDHLDQRHGPTPPATAL